MPLRDRETITPLPRGQRPPLDVGGERPKRVPAAPDPAPLLVTEGAPPRPVLRLPSTGAHPGEE